MALFTLSPGLAARLLSRPQFACCSLLCGPKFETKEGVKCQKPQTYLQNRGLQPYLLCLAPDEVGLKVTAA